MEKIAQRRKTRFRILEWQSLGTPFVFLLGAVIASRLIGSSTDLKLDILNGLVGFVVGGVFLLISRLYALEDQLHLDQEVHRHDYLAGKLLEIAQKFKEVESKQALSPVVGDEAGKLLDACAANLSDLVDGTFSVVSYVDRMGLLARHLDDSKSTVRATSYVSTHWWTSIAGRNYAECNYEAAARGCIVERVFILTKKQIEELNSANQTNVEIKQLMDEQVGKNIRVFIADHAFVEDPSRGLEFSNLLVCDDAFASVNKDTPDLTGESSFTPMPATFVYDRVKVAQYIAKFTHLKRCAAEYKPTSAKTNAPT